MQIRRSVMIYWPNPPLNFRPESEIGAKIFVLHAKSKIRAQKIDESAFRCSCRIRKSVKISLWIRNPCKNISKIRRSVRLFTPLNLRWMKTFFTCIELKLLLLIINRHLPTTDKYRNFKRQSNKIFTDNRHVDPPPPFRPSIKDCCYSC